VFLVAIGPEGRARTRIHIGMLNGKIPCLDMICFPRYLTIYHALVILLKGSKIECQHALQSFGLPADQVPINTNSGKLKVKCHQKWIVLRCSKEEARRSGTEFHGIECPEHKDLLFGRGRPIMRHPGNALLRNLLQARYQEYDEAPTRTEKTKIAWSIVCQLQQSSCRFLKEDPIGYWVEVSSEIARQKVSVAFRDLRKNLEDNMVQQAKTSSLLGVKRNLNCSTSLFLGIDGHVKRQR
jgi:hypothetical protein